MGHNSERFGRLPIVSIGPAARVPLLMAFTWLPDRGMVAWVLFLGYAAAPAFNEGAEWTLLGDFGSLERRGAVRQWLGRSASLRHPS